MTCVPNSKILLIGGAGFIGHHLALRLQALGADVAIVDGLQVNNLLSFLAKSHIPPENDIYIQMLSERLNLLRGKQIPVHVLDARDYHALGRLMGEFCPQVVVQLAAVAHANTSNKDPFSTFDHSLRTLENALDCSRNNVEHFVYFSSSMVYGNFPDGRVSEETPCDPLGIYGGLKLAGEKIVVAYNQTFDLPYTIIRPSALYGERCVSRRVGQVFIENALQGLEITIKGDGSESLDFTYIDDLISGVVKVIESPAARNQIFNITFGESRPIADLVQILQQHLPPINIRQIEWDRLTPRRGTLSIDKARELLDYRPQFPLEQGLVKYLNWYKHFLTGSHSSPLPGNGKGTIQNLLTPNAVI